jgi:hypothetical protein
LVHRAKGNLVRKADIEQVYGVCISEERLL